MSNNSVLKGWAFSQREMIQHLVKNVEEISDVSLGKDVRFQMVEVRAIEKNMLKKNKAQ